MFTDDERVILRNTTFRDIIIRNLADAFRPTIPQNIWSLQPTQKLTTSSSDHLNRIVLWPAYVINYAISGRDIKFQVQLQTANGEAWFGMVSLSFFVYEGRRRKE